MNNCPKVAIIILNWNGRENTVESSKDSQPKGYIFIREWKENN